ncbi:MAG TPA: membrane dipeptidase [Clostridia bacterium]|nr:membrane dipeptidase [Clostridia bacterium]
MAIKEPVRDPQSVYRDAIVIDGLNASMLDVDYLKKMQEAGVTAFNFTVAMMHNLSEAMKAIADVLSLLEKSGSACLVKSVRDIRECKRTGKVGLILGFQNVAPLEANLGNVRIFKEVGVGIIQLSYHFRNVACDGAKERVDGGLSLFGIELVKEMNRQGVVIDLAHVGDRASLEAIECSSDPVLMTHSNCYALAPTFQNKKDEIIRAMAAKGGVIGITGFPRLLMKDDPTLEDMLDHIDHVAELVGPEHIGIGSDFAEGWADDPARRKTLLEIDGTIYTWPRGFGGVHEFSNIADGLASRGYSDEEIKGILGGNFLRVFQTVWKE